MWEAINSFLTKVDDFVWGPPLMILIIAGGILLTIRMGVLQVRKLPLALKWMVKNEEEGEGEVTSFGALCTALSATIGTGNIVGVATAIGAGGPGALFWMVLAAFFGMATKYAEGLLAVKYRVVDEDNHALGGPFYYIEKGMGTKWKWLAKIFAFFGICVGLFGIGTFSQVNGIASAVEGFFDPNESWSVEIPGIGTYSWTVVIASLILSVCVALVLIGGIKRIANVSQIVVPFMAVLYVLLCLVLLISNIKEIPDAFVTIVKGAFNPKAVTGGVVGTMIVAMQKGVARGIFSNEAGLGSAVMVNSASNVKEPVHQGMWGVFEVFADTIVVCTLTALVILTTGVVDLESGAVLAGVQDNALVGQAFTAAFGSFGPKFIAVSILLFAYSTTLGWSHYGTKAVEYLFGTAGSRIYKVVFVCMTVVGATMKLGLAWDLSDTFNGLMMIPNLIGVLALSGTVVDITRNYFARRVRGEDIEPMWSAFEEYQKEEEAEAAAEEAELDKAANK